VSVQTSLFADENPLIFRSAGGGRPRRQRGPTPRVKLPHAPSVPVLRSCCCTPGSPIRTSLRASHGARATRGVARVAAVVPEL